MTIGKHAGAQTWLGWREPVRLWLPGYSPAAPGMLGALYLLPELRRGGDITDAGIGQRQPKKVAWIIRRTPRVFSQFANLATDGSQGIFSAPRSRRHTAEFGHFTSSAIALSRSIIIPFTGKMIVIFPLLSFLPAQSMMSYAATHRGGSMPAEFLDIAMTPDVMDVQHEMAAMSCGRRRIASAGGERFGASGGDDCHPRQFSSGHLSQNRLALCSTSRRSGGLCICWMKPPGDGGFFR